MPKKQQKKMKITNVIVQTKKKPKPKKKLQTNRMKSGGGVSLHACTARYLTAAVDPWNPDAFGACVPIDNMYPSQKYHSFMRGTCTIGTGGYGLVLISPCLANDSPCVYQTTAGFAGVDSTSILLSSVVFTGNYDAFNLTTPYTTSELDDLGTAGAPALVKGRIVGAGVKWWYSGQEVERAGYSASHTSQYHDTIEGYTVTDLISRPTVNVRPNNSDRKKHSASIFGIRNSEMVYPITTNGGSGSADSILGLYPYSSNKAVSVVTGDGCPITILIFHGVAATRWQWEYCQHNEYMGRPCDFAATKNDSDPEGVGKVQAAMAEVSNDPRVETTYQSVVRRLSEMNDDTRRQMVRVGAHLYNGYKEFKGYTTGGNSFRRAALGNSPHYSSTY